MSEAPLVSRSRDPIGQAVRMTCASRRQLSALAVAMCAALLAGPITPASGAEGPNFTRTPYGAAEIVDDHSGTLVRVTERPGGVEYSASLDPATTYRLRIRGATSANGIVLRVTQDGEWTYTLPSASGRLELHVARGTRGVGRRPLFETRILATAHVRKAGDPR